MATSQEVIQMLRSNKIPEDIIAKKVKELGGTYTAPTGTKSTLSTGITGPSALIAQTNLPQPKKSIFERIGNFLAPTTTANIKDVISGAKTGGYVASQEANTQKLLELNKLMKKARELGDMETYQRLAQESKALGQASETEMPEFSQYTQDQVAAGKTGNSPLGFDYWGRGLKSGVEVGSYLAPYLPAAKGLTATKQASLLAQGLNPKLITALNVGQKAGMGALGGGMRGFGSSGYGKALGGTLGGAAIGGGMSALGQGLKWTGKKIAEKAIQASGTSENVIIKKFGQTVNDLASKYGKNTDELLGPISEKNRGGTLGAKLKEAEGIIQQTIDEAGSNLKIDGKIVTKALKEQLKIHQAGLDDEVVAGLKQIIKNAEQKYKNGITAKQALNILRAANSKFGKAMATTPRGSTAKIAQMTVAETMRDTLKQMFPELKDALTTQSEILTLRPIIEKARGSLVQKAGQGLIPKGFELTRPLTYPIIGPILQTGIEKGIPSAISATGSVLSSPLTRQAVIGGLSQPTGQEPMQEEPIQPTGLETGELPTPQGQVQAQEEISQEPILSPGGQWKWDATQNDWVPYQATEQTGQMGGSLTGYTPETLYSAAIKAYQAGDKSAYSQLINMYEDETKYQEKQAKAKKEAGKGTVSSSIDMMEQLYGAGTGQSLSMGAQTVGLKGLKARGGVEYKKLSDQNYVDRLNNYKTQMGLVAGAINVAAGAGVLNGGEYERLAMKSFPNEYTSETVARAWFENARKVLNALPEDRLSQFSEVLENYSNGGF